MAGRCLPAQNYHVAVYPTSRIRHWEGKLPRSAAFSLVGREGFGNVEQADVRGRRLHSSQELTEMPGGMLRVRLRLDSLEEAERWVLGMGGHGTVVRPEALRQRLAKVGGQLVERYGT